MLKAPSLQSARIYLLNFRFPLYLGLCFGVVTAIWMTLTPNRYRSVAKILSSDARAGLSADLGGLTGAAASLGVNTPDANSPDSIYPEVLSSRWMAESLLQMRYDFETRNGVFGRQKRHCETLERYLNQKNHDQSVVAISKILSSVRDPKTRVLEISAETTSPVLSRAIVGSAINFLEQFAQHRIQTKGKNKAEFSSARLSEARSELNESEGELRAFLSVNHGYPSINDAALRLRGARLEMEYKLRQQLVATISVNKEQALMDQKNDMPILNVLDAPSLPEQKSGPSRISTTIVLAIMGFLLGLGWKNRVWMMSHILVNNDQV